MPSKHHDKIEVRIRGKNNQIETRTGSVTRTMVELNDAETRRREMMKASERLRQLERLEQYREERLGREISLYEEQRRREDDEVKRQRDTEHKRQKYFDKKKEQLGDLMTKKVQDDVSRAKEVEAKKEKERQLKVRREKELEDQKRKIIEYKLKKRQTEQLLANANYVDFEDIANEDADINQEMDDAQESYQQESIQKEGNQTPNSISRRRPPAIQ